MADVDETLKHHAHRLGELDNLTTRHDVRLELAEKRLDDGKTEMAAIRERMDINHSETTRQLATMNKLMGEVNGSLRMIRWGIPTAVTIIGVAFTALGVIGKTMGWW